MSYFLGYAWIPLISGLVFLGGLIAMLAAWAAEGHPQYKPGEGSIAYISDVGAHLKPLFITICAITAPGFVLSQAIDRFLRHKGRLAPNNHKREKWMSWLSMLFSTIGGIALILLSIFDAFNHSTVHWSMTGVFVVAIALSAICQTAEFGWLERSYEGYSRLRVSYLMKLFIVVTAVGTAIAMGVLMAKRLTSAAAVCEWVIAFIFDFYLFSLVYDIRPAVRTSKQYREKHPLEDQPLPVAADAMSDRTQI